MYSHGLGCHNLMARIMGRDGVARRWNRHRDRKGGGVSSVHLLYSVVANICVCGLPLTGGGVGIWLCWYRWLARAVGVVSWPGSASTWIGLINIPQLTKFFANFAIQSMRTKKTVFVARRILPPF